MYKRVCNNCKKEVPMDAVLCPYCGMTNLTVVYQNFSDDNIQLQSGSVEQSKSPLAKTTKLKKAIASNKKRGFFIGFIAIVVIVVALIIVNHQYFSVEYKLVKQSIAAVQDTLLNPDSLVVYSCEYLLDDDNKIDYVYLYIGAQNKSGGISDCEYMVHFENNRIESVADEDEANKSQMLGSTAASQLWYQQYVGRDSYIDVSEKWIKRILR